MEEIQGGRCAEGNGASALIIGDICDINFVSFILFNLSVVTFAA